MLELHPRSFDRFDVRPEVVSLNQLCLGKTNNVSNKEFYCFVNQVVNSVFTNEGDMGPSQFSDILQKIPTSNWLAGSPLKTRNRSSSARKPPTPKNYLDKQL